MQKAVITTYKRNYYLKNRDRFSKRYKEYYKKHRKERIAYSKKWAENNAERVAKRQREKMARLRLEMFKAVGDKCVKCGFSDKRALQIDHKDGGGTAERRKFHNLYSYSKYVLSHLDKYQILCANCNWIKRYRRKELN